MAGRDIGRGPAYPPGIVALQDQVAFFGDRFGQLAQGFVSQPLVAFGELGEFAVDLGQLTGFDALRQDRCLIQPFCHLGQQRCGCFGRDRLLLLDGLIVLVADPQAVADELVLRDQVVAGGLVGRGYVKSPREHRRPAVVHPQAEQDRCEVRVAREDDELLVMGGMVQGVEHVHNQVDVGARFPPGGERRAVHHLEGGTDKVGAEIGKALGVEVAAPDQDAPPGFLLHRMFKPVQPAVRVGGELVGNVLALLLKADEDVIEVDK